jgi:NTE family protein
MKKYKTGFVLSGGGARGFAHLGMLHYFREQGIYPDIISGVSAGAIAGAFIASGKTPLETHKIVSRRGFLHYTKIQLPIDGFFRLDGLEELLRKEIKQQNIEDLDIPLVIGATNLNTGKMEYFTKGSLYKTVLASSSIPVLFPPVTINDAQYIDGGVLDNLPLQPIQGKCKFIITQNINPVNETGKLKNLIQIATRSFYIQVHARIDYAKKHSHLYIEPTKLDRFDVLKASQADEIFEIGYTFAKTLDLSLLKNDNNKN